MGSDRSVAVRPGPRSTGVLSVFVVLLHLGMLFRSSGLRGVGLRKRNPSWLMSMRVWLLEVPFDYLRFEGDEPTLY